MFKYLALCTVLLSLSTVVHGVEATTKQQKTQLQAIADAKKDAERLINDTIWRVTGCFGSILGIGAAFVYEPALPASAFIGKTPEYVAYYTDEFRRKTQDLQIYHASTGCVSGAVISFMLWVVL